MAFDELFAHQGYLMTAQEGAAMFTGVVEDRIARVVSGEPAAAGPPAYGGVAGITGQDDIDGVERAQAELASDPSFVELVDRIGPAYRSHTEQTLLRRLS